MAQFVSITSTRDGKSGSTTVDEFDDRALLEAVRLTKKSATISPPDPEAMPSLELQKYPAIENYPETTAMARNRVMIPQIRAIVEAAKSKSLIAAGFFERPAETSAIANKRGNFGYGRIANAGLSATVRNSAGASSGWASQPAVRIEEIDGAEIAKIALDKCLRWNGPKRLDLGKYTVVLEPTAVSDLVTPFISHHLLARAAEEGRSFFSKKSGGTSIGEKLFPEFISLRTDPSHLLYSALPWQRPLFQNGNSAEMPVERTSWIENGVLKNFFYDRYWAGKAGKRVTALPTHLVLAGGEKELPELIASIEHGLLVTHFFYIRVVNPQTAQATGLTRDGLFLTGAAIFPFSVVNFRFNESRWHMLQNTIALGKAKRVRGFEGEGMVAPPLVVNDFPFTSISEAV